MKVSVGDVAVWDTKCSLYEQSRKVIEEALEVLDAQAAYDDAVEEESRRGRCADDEWCHLVDECADVITATCNLVFMLGIFDFSRFMRECEERQRERGRL